MTLRLWRSSGLDRVSSARKAANHQRECYFDYLLMEMPSLLANAHLFGGERLAG